MGISVRCQCGRSVQAGEELAGKRTLCPRCGRPLPLPASRPEPAVSASSSRAAAFGSGPADLPADDMPEFHDPGSASKAGHEKSVVLRRMFEALLDPRSIQWMLTLGGGLFVLGLLIWLVSWGVFQNPAILAMALGIGTAGHHGCRLVGGLDDTVPDRRPGADLLGVCGGAAQPLVLPCPGLDHPG